VAAALLSGLVVFWSDQIGRIEKALQAYHAGSLPKLPETGERELDRIVIALNDAGRRLEQARQESEGLARKVASGERLASIGRISAGLAHEIRNPIAAMRLKAENALLGDARRKENALTAIIGQIDRLDTLLSASLARRSILGRDLRPSPCRDSYKIAPRGTKKWLPQGAWPLARRRSAKRRSSTRTRSGAPSTISS
jgi:signal transduction histidine kinase